MNFFNIKKSDDSAPLNFELGIAVGDAFQIEGSPRFSDWYEWSHIPGHIKDFSKPDEGTQFWEKFETDIGLAKRLGAKTFRLSLAWERIEPKPGEWDLASLAHYAKMIESIHAQGMEVVLLLQSHVLPRWFAKLGGLGCEDFPLRFSEYAEKIVQVLGPVTRTSTLWLTFSKPLLWVTKAYGSRVWPPGDKDFSQMLKASAMIVQAHYLAVAKMRKASAHALRISFLQGVFRLLPKRFYSPLDWIGVFYFHRNLNYRFYRSIVSGKNLWSLPGVRDFQMEFSRTPNESDIDFIAISFEGFLRVHFRMTAPFFGFAEKKMDVHRSSAKGLGRVFKKILQPFTSVGLPIEIFECSYASSSDRDRIEFLQLTLKALQHACERGLKLKTFVYARLCDAFEWEYGLKSKRGLVALGSDFMRVPKPSYRILKSYFEKPSFTRPKP